MRELKFESHVFEVRGLKRKEVKALNKEGFNLSSLDIGNADEAMDRIFECVFSKAVIKKIDELENKNAIELWRAILKETYGAVDEEKN